MHQLGIAPGRSREGRRAAQALFPGPVEGGRLPGRPVDPASAPLLDDAQVEVPVGGLHAPRVQARGGKGQQLVADQGDRVDLAGAAVAPPPRPGEPRVDAVPAGRVEVALGRGEGQPGPHRARLLGEGTHQAVVEGRVGDHVDDGRPGRQHPVLHAQVRDAVRDVVDGPVPAVHRAVVQDEFGEPRYASGIEDRQRILLVTDRQQGREEPQVLLEQVVRGGDPALTEPDARPHPLGLELRWAGVRGLQEQRRPGLAPQLVPEQERRVGTDGDLCGARHLRRVPHVGEAGRGDLEVQLHGGARGFGDDRLRCADEVLHPLDVEAEVLAAGGHDLVVEQGVAVGIGEVGGDQVVAVERGQNADHHDPGVHLAGFTVGIRQGGAQFFGEPVEYPAAQPVRGDVHFQVEHGEFCLEIAARDALQHLPVQHFRHAVGTGEIQFDLHSHEVLRAIEALLRQQSLQSRQALLELFAVVLAIGQIEPPCHDLFPHRSVPPRMGAPHVRPPGSRVRWDDAQGKRSITSRADPTHASLS